jgi:hypothetical protein
MDTLQFQKRWPELHSSRVRAAIRCIPADVAVAMPDEWLDETVRLICKGLNDVYEVAFDAGRCLGVKQVKEQQRRGGQA